MLEIERLTIRFRAAGGRRVVAVDGLTLSIAAGEMYALVGESGSGKSVAALALCGLVPDGDFGTEIEGRASLNGAELLSLSPPALQAIRGDMIGYVFQEPSMALNPVLTVGSQLREVLGKGSEDLSEQIERSFERVAFPPALAGCYPHELSGGLLQRAMIAMAIAGRPRLLVADEPTTALDSTTKHDIMALLKSLQTEEEISVLLITHDFSIVEGYASRVGVLRQGNLVEEGETEQVLGSPVHEYTRRLLKAVPRIGSRRDRLAC